MPVIAAPPVTLLTVLVETLVPDPLKSTDIPVMAPVGVVFDVMLSKVLFVIVLVGPLEVDRLLSAYEGCGNDAVGEKLISALKEAAALRSLRPDASGG